MLSKREIATILSECSRTVDTLTTFCERITAGNPLLTTLFLKLLEETDYDAVSVLKVFLTQAQHQEKEIKDYRQAQRLYEGGRIIAETLYKVADNELRDFIDQVLDQFQEGIERCASNNS